MKVQSNFGEFFTGDRAFRLRPALCQTRYSHKFGGTDWFIKEDHPLYGGAHLLLTLDLNDPLLVLPKKTEWSVLPIVSYINCSVYTYSQEYTIDEKTRTVNLFRSGCEDKDVELYDEGFPRPSPEVALELKELDEQEIPTSKENFYFALNQLIGGKSYFRVGGKPLWIYEVVDVCCCGKEMFHLATLGYSGKADEIERVLEGGFFLGEVVLSFFVCATCYTVRCVFQPV